MMKRPVPQRAGRGANILPVLVPALVLMEGGVPRWVINARLMMSHLVLRKVVNGVHLRMEDRVGAVLHPEVVL